jgi:hypothetical protein
VRIQNDTIDDRNRSRKRKINRRANRPRAPMIAGASAADTPATSEWRRSNA